MPATPDSASPETVLAFDFGLRRIGVAVGQDVTASASPIEAVTNTDAGPDWQMIADIVHEWRPTRLIIGVPMHEDGSPSDMAGAIEGFIRGLQQFGLPIERVDERYSSIEAGELLKSERAAGLRGRIDRKSVDSTAAALIAERWLGTSR